MACAKLSFQGGRLRIPAHNHVLTKLAAPSVVCMTSKPKPKGLVTKAQGTAGKVAVELQSQPHGYISVDTSKFNMRESHDQQQLGLPPLVASLAIDGISLYRELPADIVAAAHEQMEAIAARAWPTSNPISNSSRATFLEYCRLALGMCQFY